MNVYLLSRLAGPIGELPTARNELAQLAVADERLRFARDLLRPQPVRDDARERTDPAAHGLRPRKAAEELDEILGLARQALADVRSVASSYRELSRDDEYRPAESVLVIRQIDGEVSLHIVNEGGSVMVAGGGIRNLSYRVAGLGGELHTGLDEDGRFRLRVGVPV
ncbi:MAG TPA: hypothetical protein VGL06_20645 [Pseudonocardiaceae bacterium]